MNAWQLDLMIENERAQAWEKLNAPDQYADQMKFAAIDLKHAVGFLDIAVERLADASADLTETPLQAKIDSFLEQIEDLKVDLDMIREHWERGERE